MAVKVTGLVRKLRSGDSARWSALRVRRLIGRAIVYFLLVVLSLTFLIPLIWMLSTALKPPEDVFSFPPKFIPSRFAWENFPFVFSEFPFLQSLRNTLTIMVGVMAGRLLSASLAAYAFSRLRWRGRDALFVLVLSTMMIPYYVMLLPQYLIFKTLRWLDSFKPLIVPAWFGGGAFFIFLLRQFFMTIPKDYDDAARIDGCSTLGIFWRIILPLSLPAAGTVAIFTFMGTWNDFLAPLIFLNSRPKYTLALAMTDWQRVGDSVGIKNRLWSHIMVANLLITLPPTLVFFLAQRYFIQGVVVTGIKG